MIINIFAKKISLDDNKTINKIKNFFNKKNPEIKFNIIDVITTEYPLVEGYSILCGNVDYIVEFGEEIKTIRIKDLKSLSADKEAHKEAGIEFKELLKIIEKPKQEKENKQKNYIEKDNINVGIGIGDISLTEEEVDNLLKIKKLLDGSKIVITKGDIKLEVEQ
jgi:hypothetical protein